MDGASKYEVVALLDISTWIPKHIVGVMIAIERVVMLVMPEPCFGNIYLAQYMLVVLLFEKATNYE